MILAEMVGPQGEALICCGEVPERSKGADCKSAGAAFGGSNPPLSTTSDCKFLVGDSGARGGVRTIIVRYYTLPYALDLRKSPLMSVLTMGSAASANSWSSHPLRPGSSPRSSVGRALPW